MTVNSALRRFHPKWRASRRRGLALVVILACVVLLTVMVMAYFSYSSLQRQISSSSANQTSADVFALGAANVVIGDLKQEIAAGSKITPITIGAVKVTNYFPATAQAAIPAIAGLATNSGLENLVKVSRYGTNFFPSTYTNAGSYAPSSRAINLSTTNASKNGRYINAEDWNKPLLLGRQNTNSATDDTPVAAFVPPDWILVNRAGGNPSNPSISTVQWIPDASNTNVVIGRYAYAIYDEGGLLDANVAGYPSGMSSTNAAFKSALAYTDLTRVGLSTAQIDELVKWRNHATIEGGNKATNYPAFVAGNTSGFLRAANTNLFSGKSDQLFVSRRQLVGFFNKALGGSADPGVRNALQYFTHFSRDLNQPSYVAAVQTNSSAPVVLSPTLGGSPGTVNTDKFVNPSFPGIRAQTPFARNDGTTAKIGEPLVNKRFPLNRLAWITYKGPSAYRSQSDPDIQALIADGIPWSYLQEGTAANIEKHFGLTWISSDKRWVYENHRGTSGGSRIIKMLGRPFNVPTPNANRYVQDSGRDANFFELLKAGISVGSLGKAATTSNTAVTSVPFGYQPFEVPHNQRYAFDSSVEYHIIQIGANILSAVNPTSYPVRIAFDDGLRGLWEFQGVTDLPYLQYVFNGVIRTQAPQPAHPVGGNQAVDGSPHQYPTALIDVPLTDPGNAYMVQVPGVWNPYDPNGTPGVLRPSNFRIVIDSNDPLSPSGSGNKALCHFAGASKSTAAGNAGNEGMAPPNPKYSYESDVTTGKTLEQFGGLGTTVHDAVTFADNNGALYREPTLIFDTTAPGGATRVGALSGATPSNNISSIDANPLINPPPGSSSGPYAPLVLGQFPLAFTFTSSGTSTTCYTGHGFLGLSAGSGDNRVYFTYRLQYQDPNDSSNWITYDTKYGRTTHGLFGFQNNYHSSPGNFPSVVKGPDWYNTYSWASVIDPRTDRFGLIMDTFNGGRSRAPYGWAPPDTNPGWIYNSGGSTATLGITYPIRQDNAIGFGFTNVDSANTPPGGRMAGQTLLSMGLFSTADIPYPSFFAGWTTPAVLLNNGGRLIDIYMFAPGMYQQNTPDAHFYGLSPSSTQPSYYADADGVVRRAMGAYVPSLGGNADSTVGLPTASINGYSANPSPPMVTPASKGSAADPASFAQSQSRPLLLHRPFRTVAELGTVFRDLPWKNLDFFTPESGDAALLDLFCINETDTPNGLTAGKVNLNTRQAPVLDAVLSGAYVDDPKVSNATVGSLSPTLSKAIATALTAYTADTATYGPVKNIAELIGSWKSPVANAPRAGVVYSPAIASANCGIDLPAGNYKDGRSSYIGFSGATNASSPEKELTSVYAKLSNFGNASLQTSVSQIQRFREAPVRALANAGQARVWNLLIDLVAQVGRYPSTAAGAPDPLAGFLVEGETRLWVHVSIDRLTGEVLDKQIEVVKE